ncbi:MAG: lipopolysaccharide biosynthesis protein [Gemmataceae bacterium]
MARMPKLSPWMVGAAANYLAFVAVLAVSFLLTPRLIHALGPTRSDLWWLAESLLAYVTLLDMGIAACLVRAVARGRSSDAAELSQLAASCFLIYSLAAIGATVLGIVGLLIFAGPLASRDGDAVLFLLLMLVNVALALPLSVFPTILDGLERFTVKSLIRVGVLLLRAGLIVQTLNGDAGLVRLALVSLGTNLLEHLLMAIVVYRHLPTLSLAPRHVSRTSLRTVRTSSTHAFLAMLSGRITQHGGAIVIAACMPVGGVTAFSTAMRLVDYSKTLLRTITATLTPGIAALEAQGEWVTIRGRFLSVSRGVLTIALPVQMGIILFGETFLQRWVGDHIAAPATLPLTILGIALAPVVAQSVASRILYGLGELRTFARLALVESAAYLLLLALLIHPLGLPGVALAVTLPSLGFCFCVVRLVLNRLQVPLREYLACWQRPLAGLILPLLIWNQMLPVTAEWPALFLAILAGLAPYMLLMLSWEWFSARRRQISSDSKPLNKLEPMRTSVAPSLTATR